MIDPIWTPGLYGQHEAHFTKRLAAAVVDLEKEFAWCTNAPLDGLSLNQNQEGWLLVVRTHSVSRGKLVSFTGGESAEQALTNFLERVAHRDTIDWKPDRFRST